MSGIISFFESLFAIIGNIISSILWFVTNLPSLLATLNVAVGYAPPFVLPFLLISISVTALFAIIRLL